jgi:hypothetical protein
MKDKKIFLNADGKRADPGCFIPQLQGVASEASEGQVGYNHSLHWFDDSEDHMTTDETEEPEAARIGPAN